MRAKASAVLLICLAAAEIASAQIPRDPTSAGTVGLPSSAAGGTAGSSSSAPNTGGQATGAAPYVTRQTDVEIPFSVRAGATPQSQPTAVRVFVSWDRGQSWHFYDERKPTDRRFRFRAKQDGEFWFATQTIDASGKADSPEPRTPQLRLIIDTQRPQLLVQAAADGSGNVNMSWSAADANLAPTSLKFEYQDATGTGGPWQPVALPGSAATTPALRSGKAQFHPLVSSSAINVRAEIADAAGNMAYFSQRLSLIPPKPKTSGSLAYSPPPDPSATHWPTNNPHSAVNTTGQLAASDSAAPASGEIEEVRIPNVVSNPFAGPGRLASNRPSIESLPPPGPVPSEPTTEAWHGSSASPTNEPLPSNDSIGSGSIGLGGQTPLPSQNSPPSTQPSQRRGWQLPEAPQPRTDDITPLGPAPETMPAPPPSEPVDPPTPQRPRLTNSRRFSLEYDIQTVGPEGVAAVELWGTTDGGRTWSKWGADPDRTSPFDVEVNQESVYGFRIVIVGKNGLATTTPQPGEAADIWVGIDLTRPTAKLTGAAYGQGAAAGKLDIRWQADDANLGPRPINLLIGDRPDGPFTPIGSGLPNTGQYYWEYDPRSPRQIYLRLEVRDEAGNIAIDQLTEPIKVEGLEPKGQIRGFRAGPETNRGSRDNFRSPRPR
jgi:hypothetical protein